MQGEKNYNCVDLHKSVCDLQKIVGQDDETLDTINNGLIHDLSLQKRVGDHEEDNTIDGMGLQYVGDDQQTLVGLGGEDTQSTQKEDNGRKKACDGLIFNIIETRLEEAVAMGSTDLNEQKVTERSHVEKEDGGNKQSGIEVVSVSENEQSGLYGRVNLDYNGNSIGNGLPEKKNVMNGVRNLDHQDSDDKSLDTDVIIASSMDDLSLESVHNESEHTQITQVL